MDLWRVERVETRELECSFAGPASATVTQLVADGEILADAVEYPRWRVDPVQVELCAECGVAGCAPQGWVRPRRAGDRLLWLPAFDELVEDMIGRAGRNSIWTAARRLMSTVVVIVR